MGKYIRKCRGGGAATAAAAVVVAGVRTRSRSAAAATAPAPKRPRNAAAGVDTRRDDGAGAAEGCCYLQLRSRRLFMVAAEVVGTASPRVPCPAEEEEDNEASRAVPLAVTGSAASVEAVAGVSRCSSTASSVDAAALRARNGCAVEQAREDCGEESSISDSRCASGQWREATPSSRAPGDLSDQESSKAADDPNHHRQRSSATAATTTTTVACGVRMPPAEEIEEFFAAAEQAEAKRFSAKYNFDVVRGVPLNAGDGRFEWTPVTSGG